MKLLVLIDWNHPPTHLLPIPFNTMASIIVTDDGKVLKDRHGDLKQIDTHAWRVSELIEAGS